MMYTSSPSCDALPTIFHALPGGGRILSTARSLEVVLRKCKEPSRLECPKLTSLAPRDNLWPGLRKKLRCIWSESHEATRVHEAPQRRSGVAARGPRGADIDGLDRSTG